MIIVPEQVKYKYVDISDAFELFQQPGKVGYDLAKNMLARFDVETANRNIVKHYPIQATCEGLGDTDWTIHQLESAANAMYLTFFQYAKQALQEKHGDLLVEELMSDRQLGKLLVCAPNKFQYAGTKLDKLTFYAFAHHDEIDDRTLLMCETNFTIQLY